MATLEQEREAREELKRLLAALTAIDIPSLIRKEELGTMNFESALPFFERDLRFYRELAKLDLDSVPFGTLNQLRGIANDAVNMFKQVQEFSFTKHPNNTQAVRDQFINAIRDRYDQDFTVIAPVIAFAIRRGTDFDRLESEAKRTVSSINQLLEDGKKVNQETAAAAQSTLEEVRKLAREAGVSQHAELFKGEAGDHAGAANRWLWATIIAAGLTIAVALTLLVTAMVSPYEVTGTKAIQIGIAKIAVLSLLFSAVVWTGRTYRAHRHNNVINRHRSNALRTFETFARAASDETTKNAVLLQATQCIFSPQQTGYISSEPEITAPSQVLEIVRSIGKTGS